MKKPRQSKKSKSTTELPLPNPHGRGTRLLITLLPIVVILLARHIVLPGVDMAFMLRMHTVEVERMSIVALGIAPIITAALVVEIVAALVPRWKHLRHGGIAGRAKLQHAADILAVVLALYQSYALAVLLQQYVVFNRGIQSVLFLMATLTAATMGLKLLADFVSTRGLVNGYGVVVGASTLLDVGKDLVVPRQPLTPVFVAALIGKIAAIALLTWFLLQQKHKAVQLESGPVSEKAKRTEQEAIDLENPYAAPGKKSELANPSPVQTSSSSVVLLGPAAGVVPYSTALSVLAIPMTFASYFSLFNMENPLRDNRFQIFAPLVLIPVMSVFLAWLFQQPRRVAQVYARLAGAKESKAELEAEARNALWHSAAYAVLFTLGLFAIQLVTLKYARIDFVVTVSVVLLVAVILDLTNEYKISGAHQDLVPIWPEHRPYALAAARTALEREGVFVHIRNERQRRILQFGAAYVPMEICVPRAEAEKALKIVEKVLMAKPGDEVRDAETYAPVSSRRYASISYGLVFGIVALSLVTLDFSIPDVDPKRAKAAHAMKLEFVLVDDDHAITDEIKDTFPQRENEVRIDREQVSIGVGKMAVREYAFVKQADGETLDAARMRLEKWVKSIPLPAGTRVTLSEYQEYDQDTEKVVVIGWRTYLLKGEAILQNADVREAQAFPAPKEEVPGWLVRLTLTQAGATRFEKVTEENIKRRFAIVLDGLVKSAPVIQTKIPGGVATITMGSTDVEKQRIDAQNLELVLNSP